MEQIYSMLGISAEVEAFGNAVLKDLKERFEKIDAVAEYNQAKVLRAMQEERVDGTCFAGSTGYGYNDNGRDKLEKVYARCFGTEAALVRPQITCGTHALAIALSANLLPGEFVRVEMVCRPFLCRVVRFVAEHAEFLLFRPLAAESVVTEVADADHDESLQIRTAVQRTAAFP